jgi:flap endonuclease-1
MGVKMLNKLIRDKCEKSLYNIPLSKLRNKKIAVDVSIYMYRFLKKNELISSFYNMCSIFRKYNIHPIFVFDGKPPIEKNDTIKKRSTEKKFYRGKIEEYKQQIEELKKTDDETTNYKIEMLNEMIETLEPKTVVVKEYNIRDMKSFIRKYGMSYIDCVEEADVLCSKMCINGDVYAVLSEDMDIFVYGCPRVLRYFSLIHEECVMYDLSRILNQLNMNLFQFRILCILAGTDYKSTQDKYHLNIFKYFDYINNKK